MQVSNMTARPFSYRSFDSLAVATAAFHRGDFAFALRAVEAHAPTTMAHALRSQILRRTGRVDEAHDAARMAVAAVLTIEDRAFAACALVSIYIVLGRQDDAVKLLDGLEDIRTKLSPLARGRIGFFRAFLAWFRGDAVTAEHDMLEAYRSDDPFERMCALQLHAYIYALSDKYVEACEMLIRALKESDKAPSAPWVAEILSNVSFLTAELAVKVDLPDLRRRLREFPWTPELARHRFLAYRNFGLRLVVDGGVGAHLGILMLQQSSECAATPAQGCLVRLDASQAAFCLGEPEHGRAHLVAAQDMLVQVDWSLEDRDERLALLTASEVVAPTDPARAHEYLEAFQALPPMSALQDLSHGNRLPAMVAHAEGVIARWAGNESVAVERFTFALEAFEAMKYRWRAADACLELHAITKNALYLSRADELLNGDYKESWLRMLLKAKHGGQDPSN